MKKLIFAVSVLCLSLTANASYFQEHCSNAARTVAVSSGHSKNQVALTEQIDGDDGRSVKPVLLDFHDVAVDDVETRELEQESKKFCHKDRAEGYATWRTLAYKKAVIRKHDGSSFSKDIIGVSEDGKSITASLICEVQGNSETLCP